MASRSRQAIRLFLASPSDVPTERAATESVIAQINQTMGPSLGFVIEVVRWENVTPSMGRPEQIILDQTEIDDCDLFVGILWNRFGTPTGRANSGTEEEFLIAYESWRQHKKPHIMFYFCQQSANLQSEEELHQKLKVIQFRKSISDRGLFAEYTEPGNFETLLRQHITSHLLSRLKKEDAGRLAPSDSNRETPDAHIKPMNHVRGRASPQGMVLVPGGSFYVSFPKKAATLDYDFFIDEIPVTNRQFAAFLTDSHYVTYLLSNLSPRGAQVYEMIIEFGETKPDHPVVNVSWFDAITYATWCGKRLPNSLEWEKAARGVDACMFPWGNEFDVTRCNCTESGFETTTPVRNYPNGRSPYGCYDMAGNVFEWVEDWADSPRFSSLPNSEKVNRNGSYNRPPDHMVCWYHESDPPELRMTDVGFRCVFAPSEHQRRKNSEQGSGHVRW
ncbi:MAG: SUMF1/EgtB/PvdO family nonheme iron enzyme [Planctomycetes bacterium]|nr:SUMF1/EgtB/PvdO family nonheme iron enzyme [Planctomycetota bacterium]